MKFSCPNRPSAGWDADYVMMVAFKNTTVDKMERDMDIFVLLATSDSVVKMGAMSRRFLGIRKFLGIMEVMDLSG